MKAKVVIQSPIVDTYVNVVAAIAVNFPDIKEICFVFFDNPPDEAMLNSIQRKLLELSYIPPYRKGARLYVSSEEMLIDSKELLKDCILIDVSAVSKDIAVSIAASGVERQSVKIGHLKWISKIEKDKKLRVGVDDYLYEDLLSKGAMSSLLKNYVAKKHVLRAFAIMFSTIFIIAIAKFILPNFIIPDDVINLFSLLIGAAGLYLAAISLKK
ncbi:MAG: hypothetical protein WBB08_06260 [Halobacteriota archaeon]